jgi:hypothetical protein
LSGQAGPGQDALHRGAMDAQLGGDGADAPVFHMMVTEDAGLQFVRDGHIETVSGRVKGIA